MARLPKGVSFTERPKRGYDRVLTSDAVAFVAELHSRFEGRRRELLKRRAERQAHFDKGAVPDFLPETRAIREGAWTVAPIPADLQDRRVEITGPTDRKMVINALNSGAKVFMTDFEDANSPTFDNMVQGQINLMDRWAGALDFTDPESGKSYALKTKPAVLLVRPRGWHLPEAHMAVEGSPVAGAFFDFGLYFFHNAKPAVAQGSGPYFYLPKLESHREAALWNDVFIFAQSALDLPLGTIKATVLIETLPAAFEMNEILHALRDHIVGLNCGRWDYIFSSIKTLRNDPTFVLPDRGQVTMEAPFLRAYTQLLIKTCHRRGAHAMGGMAAQIPIKDDPEANEKALDKVRADKLREVREGHDGTWVAHPALVSVAKQVFDAGMPGPNQLTRMRDDVTASAAAMVEPPPGTRTEAGLRLNIRVAIRYLEAWLNGQGAVPIYNLMEDAATAEISRTQIWQWLHHKATLEDGRPVTRSFVKQAIAEESAGLSPEARALFEGVATSEELQDFLTLPAYDVLTKARS